MTRDVLIRITGLQIMDGQDEDVEMITVGDYFLKNGKHYVVYDEIMEGFEGSIRNTMQITSDKLDIMKKGIANSRMVFEKDHKSQTRYVTPMGEMIVGVATSDIGLEEEENRLRVSVAYSLDINYSHVSDCNITVDVCSREGAGFNLS